MDGQVGTFASPHPTHPHKVFGITYANRRYCTCLACSLPFTLCTTACLVPTYPPSRVPGSDHQPTPSLAAAFTLVPPATRQAKKKEKKQDTLISLSQHHTSPFTSTAANFHSLTFFLRGALELPADDHDSWTSLGKPRNRGPRQWTD